MELIDIQDEDRIIYQHNTITSGKYDYSACMLDILFMILSSLKDKERLYTIHISDIELITGRKWNYTQLYKSTEIMGTRMFEIKKPTTETQLWLFSSITHGNGKIVVKINEDALPFFFELKNNFTAMQLKSVLNCSSKYAKRLYSIGCQWRTIGVKRYEIKELKEMLGMIDKTGKELFDRISQFKERVLDVAMQQINDNTDIEMSYELRKRGRSFHWITFYIDRKDVVQLEINFDEPIENQKFKSKIMAYNLTEEQANAIVQKEKEKDFDILITKLNERVRQGKLNINNSSAYLVGVYQKKGIIENKTK